MDIEKIDKYLEEAGTDDNYADYNKNLVLREITIWFDSMKFAHDQLKQGNYDNALKTLDTQKRISGRLHTAVKNLKQDAEKGVTKKRKFQF